jgi:protein-tyrosine phosphatase
MPFPSNSFRLHLRTTSSRGSTILQCYYANGSQTFQAFSRQNQLPSIQPSWTLRLPETGERLPPAIQQKMENVFHTSFRDVRVHIGQEALSIGALAFTNGSQIYFAPGQYQPLTVHGQRLLGHELTHVVQQKSGRVRNPFGSGVAIVQDPHLEAEADRMGLLASAMGSQIQLKTVEGANTSEIVAPLGMQSDIFRFGHVVIPDHRRFIIVSTKEDAEVIRTALNIPHIDLSGKDFIENIDCSYDLPGITEEVRTAAAKIPNSGNVLINCMNGRSRSAAAVIAFLLMRRRFTWRSAKARVQRFYDAHRTNRIMADREERFSGCFDKLVRDLELNTNSLAPMPGSLEIEESIRFRNQFYAQLHPAQRRRLAYGIANFPGYRAQG